MSETKRLRLIRVLFLILWILFILYPNPLDLAKSIYRLKVPPINPHAEEVLSLAEEIGSKDPFVIEEYVKKVIPYQYDWIVYNRPWYFPTVEEVFKNNTGDCKSKMIVLASVLQFHKKEYMISASPVHLWVDYEGKKETAIEKKELVLFSHAERLEFQVPKIDLINSSEIIKRCFWDYMPQNKKTSLFVGVIIFLTLKYVFFLIINRIENRINYLPFDS